jgi:hypothetical protein
VLGRHAARPAGGFHYSGAVYSHFVAEIAPTGQVFCRLFPTFLCESAKGTSR